MTTALLSPGEIEAKKAKMDELIVTTMTGVAENGGSVPPYYTCSQCQKIFWSDSSLKHHCSLYHSEKAFVCEICGKAFRFRSNLAEHRSVHTAVKPYVCKFCGKSSRLKGNLTKHILKHHKKEQNAYIGKDDIIIKKGKKSVKDPMAVDFLEKSMIVLSTENTVIPSAALHLYTMAQMANSEGLDLSNLDLSAHSGSSLLNPELLLGGRAGAGSETGRESSSSELQGGLSIAEMGDGGETSSPDPDYEGLPVERRRSSEDEDSFAGQGRQLDRQAMAHLQDSFDSQSHDSSPVHRSTGTPGAASGSGVGINGSGTATRCTVCGKHFRKAGGLQLHMTLKHGYPPVGSEGPDGPDGFVTQYGAGEDMDNQPFNDHLNQQMDVTPPSSPATVRTSSGSVGSGNFGCRRSDGGPANQDNQGSIKIGIANPPPLKVGNRFALMNGGHQNNMHHNHHQPQRSSTSYIKSEVDQTQSQPMTNGEGGTKRNSSGSIKSRGQELVVASKSLDPADISAEHRQQVSSGGFASMSTTVTPSPSLLSSDLRELKEVLREIRSSGSGGTGSVLGGLLSSSNGDGLEEGGAGERAGKLENLLVLLDSRVGRLEKQVESSLTSLYSLVQLQSTMNSAFTRFRDDISAQLRGLQNLLLQNAASPSSGVPDGASPPTSGE